MIIKNSNIVIEGKDIKSFEISDNYCKLDIEGFNVMVDIKIFLRLYEVLKHQIEKSDKNFEEFCLNLFKNE